MDRTTMNHSQAQRVNLDGTGVVIKGQQQQPLGKSTISVQSSGEVRVPPDILHFTVTVRNSKESLEEAQTSVKRRTDYISQVARKNGVKAGNIVISTDVTQAGSEDTTAGHSSPYPLNSISRPGLAMVHTEVTVSCDNVSKCEAIRNTLIEKLDNSVEISPVSFMHSAEAKEKAR